MTRRRALLAVTVLLPATTGCLSLARIVVREEVRSESGAGLALRVTCDAPGPVLTSPALPVADAALALILYPLDVLASTSTAVSALTDEDLGVRFGSAGALAGIALPWLTLVPYLKPPLILPERRIGDEEFARLAASFRTADEVAVYRELLGDPILDAEVDVHSVEAVGPPE
ncbi:MAG: hypothetical protein ACF8XB_02990 [Planctomycetota bacterium JB042]